MRKDVVDALNVKFDGEYLLTYVPMEGFTAPYIEIRDLWSGLSYKALFPLWGTREACDEGMLTNLLLWEIKQIEHNIREVDPFNIRFTGLEEGDRESLISAVDYMTSKIYQDKDNVLRVRFDENKDMWLRIGGAPEEKIDKKEFIKNYVKLGDTYLDSMIYYMCDRSSL